MSHPLVDRYAKPAEGIFSAAINNPAFSINELWKRTDMNLWHGEQQQSATLCRVAENIAQIERATSRSSEGKAANWYSTMNRWLLSSLDDFGYYVGWPERLEPPHVAKVVAEVTAIIERCGRRDWDGEGARPVHLDTIRVAQQLARRLPRVDPPDVSATPHGEIDFDWCVARDQMLTVSVGPPPQHEIAFAGLFGSTRIRGRERWAGEVPHFVRCCFEMIGKALAGHSEQ